MLKEAFLPMLPMALKPFLTDPPAAFICRHPALSETLPSNDDRMIPKAWTGESGYCGRKGKMRRMEEERRKNGGRKEEEMRKKRVRKEQCEEEGHPQLESQLQWTHSIT